MKRIILSIVWGLLTGWAAVPCLWAQSRTGTADREIWVKTLVRLADPVLSNLANETLKKEMPYESLAPNRQRFSYLEAVGRTRFAFLSQRIKKHAFQCIRWSCRTLLGLLCFLLLGIHHAGCHEHQQQQ